MNKMFQLNFLWFARLQTTFLQSPVLIPSQRLHNMGDITYFSFAFHYEKPNVDRSRLQIHSNFASQQSLFRWIAQDMYIRAPNAEVEWLICTLKRPLNTSDIGLADFPLEPQAQVVRAGLNNPHSRNSSSPKLGSSQGLNGVNFRFNNTIAQLGHGNYQSICIHTSLISPLLCPLVA